MDREEEESVNSNVSNLSPIKPNEDEGYGEKASSQRNLRRRRGGFPYDHPLE